MNVEIYFSAGVRLNVDGGAGVDLKYFREKRSKDLQNPMILKHSDGLFLPKLAHCTSEIYLLGVRANLSQRLPERPTK